MFWTPPNKAFRVNGPGVFQDTLSLCEHHLRSAMVNIVWGQHGDAAVSVLGVVPREECPAVGDGVVDSAEASGEPRMVLQGLDTCASENGLSSLT